MSLELANLLFPHVTATIDDLKKRYPVRPEGQHVTRFAPSPTGFLHIGGVSTGLIAERFAHQNNKNGVVFLRIEDTDQERYLDGGIDLIVNGLKNFHIQFDEGPLGEGNKDVGDYGPYIQSHRKDLYHAVAKHFVAQGLAYPCWLTTEEIDAIRKDQQDNKKIPGIYGSYSIWRDASFDKQKEMVDQGKPFVVRFRSPADLAKRVIVKDMIRGEIETQDNFIDHPLIKAKDGLPTYHFAHLVDDYLMGTTHIIRSDEWIPSFPLHLQLFAALGLKPLIYAHVSPLLKLEDGKKRKLSKRKDPEANIAWFFEQGYPVDAIIEFLMNIIDPSFEEWQKNNPDKNYTDFVFDISHMNASGALFDMVKLDFVSKEWLAKLDKQTFANMCVERAKTYGEQRAESKEQSGLYGLMQKHPEYTFAALNIERCTELDPKRYHKLSDIAEQLPMFYDENYDAHYSEKPAYPENMTPEIIRAFVEKYCAEMNLEQDKTARFEQLKEIGKTMPEGMRFAPSNAEFKEGGYIGKTGDLAMFLRIQLLLSKTTPDLCETMKVMGKERVVARLKKAITK